MSVSRNSDIHRFEEALRACDRVTAREVLFREIGAGDRLAIIEHFIVPSLERIGHDWEQGKVALSQVYLSGRICEDLVDSLLPPGSPGRIAQPAMAIALLEDYHSLGKTIISSALRASGLELRDFGRVTVAELVSRVQDHGIRILLISVLMLPSALRIKEVTARLAAVNFPVKIIVGGAPFRFDRELCREVGAAATGKDTAEALAVVTQTIEELS